MLLARIMRAATMALTILAATTPRTAEASLKPLGPRQHVSLNGEWQLAEGVMSEQPRAFDHAVPVPGLVDMAKPAFDEVGVRSDRREAFWYRRTFTIDGDLPEVALLKLHKAKYGAAIWINGMQVGEHAPLFTPGYFDVQSALRGNGAPNEIVIRVGADRESLPPDRPNGWDFEKYLYLPGIYDSVELILTGKPYIRNIQIAPDIDAQRVTIVAEIESDRNDVAVAAGVTAAESGENVSRNDAASVGPDGKAVLTLPIPNCRLWSPEDPYLYRLALKTEGDAATVRFGMRSFRFDSATKRAYLNGKPYYMRGSNVTLLRFFEDSARSDLPWRESWVRELHKKCKTMHWNSLRYCIGFPPEFWYDIADEEGILIQDEFPIWTLNEGSPAPEHPKAEHIAPQYVDWMRERWNHPSVVIWDAQNESETDETGEALRQVRELDLSGRPWDNGWGTPQSRGDCLESHPYLFSSVEWGRAPFRLSNLATHDGVPNVYANQSAADHAVIVNEYAWLWLTHNGDPTCLTQKVYADLAGAESTPAMRRRIYARYLAALTEFWRARRKCAGVLHFCVLGYSRPGDAPRPEGGATSDHWINVDRLKFEPMFEAYVRDAFAPVGVMLDFWDESGGAGVGGDGGDPHERSRVAVARAARLKLRPVDQEHDDQEVVLEEREIDVPAFGQSSATFRFEMPSDVGDYELIAERIDEEGRSVTSRHEFVVVSP